MSEDIEVHLRQFDRFSIHFEWIYVQRNYAPCRLLDYGCGYGYSAIYLAMNGFMVDGYDPDLERIAIARCLLGMQHEDIQKHARFWHDGIPKESYGLVWLSHVLEHIPIAEWAGTFNAIFSSIGNKRTPPMLVSVPLGHAYEHFQHINHWDSEGDFLSDLSVSTGLPWKVWTDNKNHVIKATTV